MATLEELERQRAQIESLMPTTSSDRTLGRLQTQLSDVNNQIRQMQPPPEPVPLQPPAQTPNIYNQNALQAPPGTQQMFDATTPQQTFSDANQFKTPEVRSVSLADTRPGFGNENATQGVMTPLKQNIPYQTTTSTVRQTPLFIPEEIKRDLTDVSQQQLNLENRKREAQNLQATEEQERNRISTEIETFAEKSRERSQEFENYMQAQEKSWQEESRKLSQEKIDSTRFWKNKSTGQIIAAGIAAAFGGIGQALAGGRNYAAEIILQAAENDVNDQIKNLDNKKAFSREQWDALQAKRRNFANDEALKKDLLSTRLKAIENKIEGYQAKAKSQDQISALEQTKEQLKTASAKARLDLYQLTTPQERSTTQVLELSPEAYMAKMKDSLPKNKNINDLYVPGVGIALTAQDAKDLKASKEAYDSTVQSLTKLKGQIKGKLESLPNALGGTKGNIETLAAGIKAEYKQLTKLGTLDSGVERLFEQLLGDLTSTFVTENTKLDKLKQFQGMIEASFKNNAKARLIPGQNLTELPDQPRVEGTRLRQLSK